MSTFIGAVGPDKLTNVGDVRYDMATGQMYVLHSSGTELKLSGSMMNAQYPSLEELHKLYDDVMRDKQLISRHAALQQAHDELEILKSLYR